MYDVITFGEPMIRYEPTNQFARLERTDCLKMTLGGAEINVTAALANVGNFKTGIITKLPKNPLGSWIQHYLDSYKVGTEFVVYGGNRVGSYYSEQGSRPRTASVVYDRKYSSFAESTISDYPINYAETHAKLFYTTGITLALSETTRQAAFEMIKSFKETETLVAFDVNYRAKLWSEEEARAAIEEILPYVDILFISEETCRRMFQRTGTIEHILREFSETYDIRIVASTQRKVITQSHHQFTSIIFEGHTGAIHKTVTPYDIEVVDRVGSGDAYIAGVLYGLLSNHFDCEIAQEYGDAFSAFNCTIPGDILISNADEINSIIKKHKAGVNEDINR